MFGKKSDKYKEGYEKGREDATNDLIAKMLEISMMNKRFAQTLIDATRGK